MNGTFTPFGRGLLLTAVFRRDVYVDPVNLWLAYTRTPPVPNSDGTQLDEPTTGGYLRAPGGTLTSDNWDWTGFAEVYNIQQWHFPTPTGDWGLITGFALCDDSRAGFGNCVVVGTQVEPFQVLNGDAAPFLDIAQLACGIYD